MARLDTMLFGEKCRVDLGRWCKLWYLMDLFTRRKRVPISGRVARRYDASPEDVSRCRYLCRFDLSDGRASKTSFYLCHCSAVLASLAIDLDTEKDCNHEKKSPNSYSYADDSCLGNARWSCFAHVFDQFWFGSREPSVQSCRVLFGAHGERLGGMSRRSAVIN